MHRNWGRSIWMSCALLITGLPAWAPAGAAAPRTVNSRNLPRAAARVPMGGRLRVENVRKPETGQTAAFVVRRFEVFAPDAAITVHGAGGEEVLPAPANAYFRGAVAGVPGSRVFLAVLADGSVQGVVNAGDESYLLGGDGEPPARALRAPLAMHRIDPGLLKARRDGGFSCGNELLPPGRSTLEGLDLAAPAAPPAKAAATKAAAYRARVAIETDYEYLQKFSGNTTAAANYIGNLIGYASTLFEAEINTSLAVQSVSLWTTSSDPWTQTTAKCGLMEFGRYWNKNKTGVSRTIAHFLSGKYTGGGIAWTGVLCSGAFGASASCSGIPTDAPWGGGYGFTGGITGTFNVSSPTVMWDILGVSHEIGHNFNSPHTHCYNGIAGVASPVDPCRSGEGGCYLGTQSLPGPVGAGSGTIMSYCHLLTGGYSNISLKFGTNHPYGVQPERVPSRMSAHVASRATLYPACLAP